MLSKKTFRTVATADMLVLNLLITKMVLKWWEKKEISSILVSNSLTMSMTISTTIGG